MEVKRAKVVMLPTEKETNIELLGTLLRYSTFKVRSNAESVFQHLYITTDDKCKEGEWCIRDNALCRYVKKAWGPYVSWKIISSTDESLGLPQPSKAFIEKYCKVGGIDEVNVELINYCLSHPKLHENKNLCRGCNEETVIKVDDHNTITIHPIKDSWNREEVERLLHLAMATASAYGMDMDQANADSWIKANL